MQKTTGNRKQKTGIRQPKTGSKKRTAVNRQEKYVTDNRHYVTYHRQETRDNTQQTAGKSYSGKHTLDNKLQITGNMQLQTETIGITDIRQQILKRQHACYTQQAIWVMDKRQHTAENRQKVAGNRHKARSIDSR